MGMRLGLIGNTTDELKQRADMYAEMAINAEARAADWRKNGDACSPGALARAEAWAKEMKDSAKQYAESQS